jgi:hypothetical protein
LNGSFKFDKVDHQRRGFDEGNVEANSIRVLPVVPKIELRHLTESTIFLDEVAVLQFSLHNQEAFTLHKVRYYLHLFIKVLNLLFSVTARQLDTDDEQPEGYEFPSLMFETSGAWQPRQTYEVASELTSGSEIVFSVACKARCQFKSQLQLQVISTIVFNSNLRLGYCVGSNQQCVVFWRFARSFV